jgi:hypothetical protein
MQPGGSQLTFRKNIAFFFYLEEQAKQETRLKQEASRPLA